MARRRKKQESPSINFLAAAEAISKEKGIDREEICEVVEQALASAYKKSSKNNYDLTVSIDRTTGNINAYYARTIVEEVKNPSTEISLKEAKVLEPDAAVGGEIRTKVETKDFSRIATQNAKQQIIQKMKEAERKIISEKYMNKKDEMVTGIIHRDEYRDVKRKVGGQTVIEQNRVLYVNIGKAEGILTSQNQIAGEHYYTGMRLKVYVVDVNPTPRGPQIILSRTHKNLIKRLFEEEVSEVAEGVVEIKSVSREAGSRSKMAVWTDDEHVDPVGTCIGPKGMRIQNILNEIGNEKIDIIKWDEDPVKYIKNALAPADVISVKILETEENGRNSALAVVDDSQLSLAIGKDGQNVRLAARLTGWKIDIKSKSKMEELEREELELAEEGETAEESEQLDIE